MFPKGKRYPEKPLPIFQEQEAESPKSIVQSTEDAIRARSKQIDDMLSGKSGLPKVIIGEKR